MKRFRISDRIPEVLDIDLTIDDIMRDLDPAWLAESGRAER